MKAIRVATSQLVRPQAKMAETLLNFCKLVIFRQKSNVRERTTRTVDILWEYDWKLKLYWVISLKIAHSEIKLTITA